MKSKTPRPNRKPSYEPTKSDIRAACEQIRKRWSSRELESRSSGRRIPWVVPEFIFPQGTSSELVDAN